jgi:hypothetical protein
VLDLSFQEKTLWGSLLSLLLVSAWYFPTTWELVQLHPEMPTASLVAVTVVAIVLLVVIQIVYHVVMAFVAPAQDGPLDEREKLISLRAGNASGLVLGVGVFCVIGHLLAGGTLGGNVGPSLTAWLLMATVVFAELVDTVLQIVGFRRAA